ncbi:UTRA domain-containing protein [Actimicrobium sp. CCI2.3]|nr:UTRA domain-containing protein [Actimicrobium sp. CCI2.3]
MRSQYWRRSVVHSVQCPLVIAPLYATRLYAHSGVTHLALAQFGVVQFQRRMSRVTARLPDKQLAQQLGQPVSLPILCVDTVYVDGDGVAIEYCGCSFVVRRCRW